LIIVLLYILIFFIFILVCNYLVEQHSTIVSNYERQYISHESGKQLILEVL